MEQQLKTRRDMGIAGLVIVVSQAVTSFTSSQSMMKEMAQFKDEFQQSQMDREQFFVRKTDLTAMNNKLDLLNERIIQMSEEIKRLKGTLEASRFDIIGCVRWKEVPWFQTKTRI